VIESINVNVTLSSNDAVSSVDPDPYAPPRKCD